MWQEGQSEVELPTEDAFQRLIAHGLAAFHGLLSFSRQGASGQGRSVTVRKPKGFGEGLRPLEASNRRASHPGTCASRHEPRTTPCKRPCWPQHFQSRWQSRSPSREAPTGT